MSEASNPVQEKSFYRMIATLVVPIIFQNIINTAVNAADIIMLGYVSQTALSASALANQPFNIVGFIYYGVSSGMAIIATQYWGKKDCRTIERVLGIALRISLAFALLFFTAAFFFPKFVMRLYTSEMDVIEAGVSYMRVISITMLFSAVTQMYLNVQRCIERVKLSTFVMTSSLLINVVLNACFIFGLGPFPKLGLIGVAIATCIARFFELCCCIIDSLRNKLVKIRIRYLWERNPLLFKDFTRFAVPALMNDVVASVGFSMYSVIMGHLGSDIVAANSVAVVARQFGSVFAFGIAHGCAIIIGKTLGENKLEKGKEYAKKSLQLAFIFGVLGGLIMILARPFIVSISQLSGQAAKYLNTMVLIQSYYVVGMAINITFFSGIFRSGGDAKFGFWVDAITLWCWMVPMGFILAFWVKLPPIWVYFFLMLDEFFKMLPCYLHYRTFKWVKNITKDEISQA